MNEKSRWDNPVQPNSERIAIPPFPVRCLPEFARAMAEGISTSTSTDPAMASAALLAACSFCFSGVYKVEGKPGHQEPLNLYVLIIAEPAERKSPVMRYIREPFDSFCKVINDKNQHELFAADEKCRLLEAELEQKRKSRSDPEELAGLREEIELLKKKKPVRITIDDATPEALAELLDVNKSLLMLSDEAGMLKNYTGRYSNGVSNLDLLLKCWGGESYRKDRCSGCSISLERPYLSLCLCSQPYILSDLMGDNAFRNSGMTARMLYVFPKSRVGERKYVTPPVNPEVVTRYSAFVDMALKHKLNCSGETILYLDDEAIRFYAGFYDTIIEPHLKIDFPECLDWGGKFHGLILRLSALIHCMIYLDAGVDPKARKIGTAAIRAAIEIANYFKMCAVRAYSSGSDSSVSEAEYVLNKLREYRQSRVSGRELLHICRKFSRNEELIHPIEKLSELGWLREIPTEYRGSGRKPSKSYEVNPKVFTTQQ
mgnify:FL=1